MLKSKQTLLSQVQNHLSCQVRNLLICVAASIENTNNNHNIKFINQYNYRGIATNRATATTNTTRLATTFNSFCVNRNYSRFTANTIQTGTEMMKFTDYDCIEAYIEVYGL